ncbi:uncharacterized protein LOC124289942 [Haliotis rubra]|uniref:uncharacterized protein LOC124289942 n=1 Tax=Haliotis rubra TaxID=36100 RepID=UPI001EE6345C|nr:uncharacterized protein LOC124289942 [Haliotis rubra]
MYLSVYLVIKCAIREFKTGGSEVNDANYRIKFFDSSLELVPENFQVFLQRDVSEEVNYIIADHGLKYVPVSAKINTDAFITSIESGLQQLAPNGNVDNHQIIDTIKKAPRPRSNLSVQERQAIAELGQNKAITITEADKGKAAVIMDTQDFEQLINNSLSDTPTYLIITKDPTAKLER